MFVTTFPDASDVELVGSMPPLSTRDRSTFAFWDPDDPATLFHLDSGTDVLQSATIVSAPAVDVMSSDPHFALDTRLIGIRREGQEIQFLGRRVLIANESGEEEEQLSDPPAPTGVALTIGLLDALPQLAPWPED